MGVGSPGRRSVRPVLESGRRIGNRSQVSSSFCGFHSVTQGQPPRMRRWARVTFETVTTSKSVPGARDGMDEGEEFSKGSPPLSLDLQIHPSDRLYLAREMLPKGATNGTKYRSMV